MRRKRCFTNDFVNWIKGSVIIDFSTEHDWPVFTVNLNIFFFFWASRGQLLYLYILTHIVCHYLCYDIQELMITNVYILNVNETLKLKGFTLLWSCYCLWQNIRKDNTCLCHIAVSAQIKIVAFLSVAS